MTCVINGDTGVTPLGPASGVAVTPVGTVAATNVQAAIQELDSEKIAKGGVIQSDIGNNVVGKGLAFSVYASTNQSITVSTPTVVNLTSKSFDTDSCFSNNKFTPPRCRILSDKLWNKARWVWYNRHISTTT